MTFVLPTFTDEQHWGPSDIEAGGRVFSKTERIGRLADWQILGEDERKKATEKAKRGFQDVTNVGELKEIKKVNKEKHGPGPSNNRGGFQSNRGGMRGQQPTRGGQPVRRFNGPKTEIFRLPTIKITDDLRLVPIEFSTLHKAPEVDSLSGQDLAVQGQLHQLNDAVNGISIRRPVRISGGAVRPVLRITEDPLIRDIVSKLAASGRRVVFGSDTVIATLMTAAKTVNSWDVQVVTNGKVTLFFERSPDSFSNIANTDSRIDLEWVNETARFNAPSEDVAAGGAPPAINSSVPLAAENSRVTREFITFAKTKTTIPFKGATASPFKTGSLFRYRKWTVGKGTPDEFDLVVRCEVDAGSASKDKENQLVRLFSLMEGPAQENVKAWGQAAQGSGLLVSAMESNAAKVAKWAALCLLSEVDLMKVALVTRSAAGSVDQHEIIHVEAPPARDFAAQVGVSLKKLLSVINSLVLTVNAFAGVVEGNRQFIMMKDPKNERLLLLEPNAAQDSDSSSSDSDSSSSSDDSSSGSDSDDSDE